MGTPQKGCPQKKHLVEEVWQEVDFEWVSRTASDHWSRWCLWFSCIHSGWGSFALLLGGHQCVIHVQRGMPVEMHQGSNFTDSAELVIKNTSWKV